ncbi:MAG: family 20 glycosylhydrolase, partial [Dehalococcoidia bacterium]|nr:family 20 glycosylhydrolase [Dehalococcoidia bacterium]
MTKFLYKLLLLLLVVSSFACADISVIPMPDYVQVSAGGSFTFGTETKISISDASLEDVASYLQNCLQPAFDYKLEIAGSQSSHDVVQLRLDDTLSALGDEGYSLEVTNEKVLISAFKPAGVFYGIQTLRQLLDVDVFGNQKVEDKKWAIEAVKIIDKPRFSWRGMHLDVSRHFMPVDFIKKYIDLIAMHKMNRFHWHLVDDQGWRIEIDKYPKLTEVGAWRDRTLISPLDDPYEKYDNTRYGGYYTKAQIRDIVSYAKKRYVEIVPEIEMPGHVSSAIAAYPWLWCSGEQ